MTVTKVQLLHSEGGEDGRGVNYNLQFGVWTNDRDDGPLTVRNAVPFAYGDPYVNGNDSDPRARALSIKEKPVSQAHYHNWTVDVDFGLLPEGDVNPLAQAVEENVSWNPQARLIYVDRNNLAMLNPAGDRYEEPIEDDDNLPVLTYSLNQAAFPFSLAMQVRNAINSTIWKGFAVGTVKVASMSSTRAYDKNIGVYYKTAYSFKFVPEGFDKTVLAQGYNQIVDSKKRPIRDIDGGLVKVPVMLDAAGAVTTTPYFQTFELSPRYDFNTLFPFL
jgi:hypothetical protein